MNICLIPARIGSKRIKEKNIKQFYGKPLIGYAITNARKSKLFEKIIVSTDSKKIAKIAIEYGAEVPFLRPKNLSNDKTTDIQVRKHFFDFCKKNNINVKYLCYLYPATPLLKVSTLKKSFKFLLNNKCSELMIISKYTSPIVKALIKGKNNQIKYIANLKKKKIKKFKKDTFFDAGQFYWYNYSSKIIKKCGFEINRMEAIDINTIKDFEYAKKIYLVKNKN